MTELDLQRGIGLAGFHDLIVAGEEFFQGQLALGSFEKAPLIEVGGDELAGLNDVYPVFQGVDGGQGAGSGVALRRSDDERAEAVSQVGRALLHQGFSRCGGDVDAHVFNEEIAAAAGGAVRHGKAMAGHGLLSQGER